MLFTCTELQSRSGKLHSWREFCWFQAAVLGKKKKESGWRKYIQQHQENPRGSVTLELTCNV